MVNYSSMEAVHRSYGPLEPIGPSAPVTRRRIPYAARNLALATLGVVVIGGSLGFYLRPETGPEPARGGPAGPLVEPASSEGLEITVADREGRQPPSAAAVVTEAAPPRSPSEIDVSALLALRPPPDVPLTELAPIEPLVSPAVYGAAPPPS
jgi:hypothetical protein